MKLNTPNTISVIRIFLMPVIVFFYLATFVPYGKFIAAIVFIIAASTDFVDGYIARKYNMVTNLGKFLDPIADKLIAISALLLVCFDGTIPAPYGIIISIIIISRELIISAFRTVAASNNIIMAADIYGKIKTVFTCIAIPMFMVLAGAYGLLTQGVNIPDIVLTVYEIVSYAMITIATLLTIYSGINYSVKNKQAITNK